MVKNKRENIIVRTSIISIVSNILLASFKAAVGLFSHSIAIFSDALNNFSDALSSIITIIGTKLAGKSPDREHPYGHGRFEYVSSFLVSGIVLYAGIAALIESIKKIIEPETPEYNIFTLIVLIAAIFVKFTLGLYVKKKGKAVNSESLVASGTDAFNDALISISVLAATLIFMISGISIEAYVGTLVAVYIIISGIELVRSSINDMLGVRVESELAHKIKKDIVKEPGVNGAFDLILNDYGPDKYLGSVHIEVADTMTVAEVDKLSRRITKKILDHYGVILHTIGVYSINTQDENAVKMRSGIEKIVFAHKEILEMHGFYVDEPHKEISFDIIIDFKADDRETIYRQIYDQVKNDYPEYKLIITLDVDTSD